MSLNAGDGVENHIASRTPSPEDHLLRAEEDADREVVFAHLRESVAHLTPNQARRLRARFKFSMKYREIARIEGVSASDISESVRAGIKKLR